MMSGKFYNTACYNGAVSSINFQVTSGTTSGTASYTIDDGCTCTNNYTTGGYQNYWINQPWFDYGVNTVTVPQTLKTGQMVLLELFMKLLGLGIKAKKMSEYLEE